MLQIKSLLKIRFFHKQTKDLKRFDKTLKNKLKDHNKTFNKEYM